MPTPRTTRKQPILADDGELLIESPIERANPLIEPPDKPKKHTASRWQMRAFLSQPIFVITVVGCELEIWASTTMFQIVRGNNAAWAAFAIVLTLNLMVCVYLWQRRRRMALLLLGGLFIAFAAFPGLLFLITTFSMSQ